MTGGRERCLVGERAHELANFFVALQDVSAAGPISLSATYVHAPVRVRTAYSDSRGEHPKLAVAGRRGSRAQSRRG
jgi:hypothetical protein